MTTKERVERLVNIAIAELKRAERGLWESKEAKLGPAEAIRSVAKTLVGRAGEPYCTIAREATTGQQRIEATRAAVAAQKASPFARWERLGLLLQKTFSESPRDQAVLESLLSEASNVQSGAAVACSALLAVPWCSVCGSRTIGRHGMGCRISYERERELLRDTTNANAVEINTALEAVADHPSPTDA